MSFFNFGSGASTTLYIDKPFQLNLADTVFVENEITGLYEKLLMDCYSRSNDLKESPIYFDNCLASENNQGLISLLSDAMYKKTDLFLVLKSDVIRLADTEEKTKIAEDYKKTGKSSIGVYCSFKDFVKTDMLKVYYSMLFNVFDTTNTQMNISKSIQVKINKLRDLVSLSAKDSTVPQAKDLVDALKNGKGIMLDKDDEIAAIMTSLDPVKAGIELVNSKVASTIGMPLSYVNGELSAGLSSSGEGDSDMVERGLKPYFNSIWKPVVDKLMDSNITFKSDSWRTLEPMLKYITVIETSDLIEKDVKAKFVKSISERI